MRKSLLRGAVVGTAAALVAGFGVSLAAWTVNGATTASEGGNSRGAKSVPLTVTTTPITQEAYPTLSTPVTVTVKNANAFSVQLGTVQTAITSTDEGCKQSLSNGYYYGYPNYYYPGMYGNNGSTHYGNGFTTKVEQSALARINKGDTAEVPVDLTFTNDFPQACEDKPLSITFTAVGSSAA